MTRRARFHAFWAAALAVALFAGQAVAAPPDGKGKGNGKGNGNGKGGSSTEATVSADPRESDQWALALIDAPGAWSTSTGSGAVVAVVDTGVDADHPEFSGQLVNGASWICPRGQQAPCGDWDDEHGHGTHVAGIVAAPRDDRGVTGVAPDAQIMPVRVLDENGAGTSDDVAAGVRWAADHGADVVNLSLGSLIPGSSLVLTVTGIDDSLLQAIEYAVSKGALVVIASGNSSLPLCDGEALLIDDGVLCVGAVDRFDLPAWYSNSGMGVDVVAPGGSGTVFCDLDVLSTWPTDVESFCEGTGYEELAGTSMATPHVAGVGALLAELGVSNTDAARIIVETGMSFTGLLPVFDPPRIDAAAAVAAAAA